jgi:hypothetical protein
MRYTPVLGQTLVNFPSPITFCRGLRTSVAFRFSRLCLACLACTPTPLILGYVR